MFIKCSVKDKYDTILEWVTNATHLSHFYRCRPAKENFFKFNTGGSITEIEFSSKEDADLLFHSLIKILEGSNEVIEKDIYLKRVDFKTDKQREEERVNKALQEQMRRELAMRLRASQEQIDSTMQP